MRTRIALALLMAAVAAAPALTQGKEPGIAGTWTMNVKSPHGEQAMTLVLEQDGTKIAGTFASGHGDHRVEGEFVNGKLSLATPTNDEHRITFTASLRDDGALAGYLSSQMGDMTFTATRGKGGK